MRKTSNAVNDSTLGRKGKKGEGEVEKEVGKEVGRDGGSREEGGE